MVIVLPWPPSVNTYWRHVVIKRSVRTLISKAGRKYRDDVKSAILAYGLSGTNLEGRLTVRIDAFPPDRRRRDLDNVPKALLDALTHSGLWLDDEQIDDLRIVRGEVIKEGRVRVAILENA